MKSFLMSILFAGILTCSNAQDPIYPASPTALQNILAAEYFIDTDPGVGLATIIPVTAGLNIINAAASINLNGLSNGFHRLFLRTKNVQGHWAITESKDFLYDFNPVYQSTTVAQNIVAAEYFIDNDPGFGAGTAIAITAGVNITDLPVTVNTAGLSNGAHRLYIRTKNAEGRWSIASIKQFIVDFDFAYPLTPAALQNIVAAEYFINTDPGQGLGSNIPVTAATNINDITVAVNTGSLTPATTNHLFIRTKNAAGHWSITNEKTFVMEISNDPPYPTAPADVQNIIAAEYFINTDSGAGSGTSINISPDTDIANINTVINTSALQPSTTNHLFIRTKNTEGHWSISNAKQFSVSITNDPAYPNAAGAIQNITKAEYFIDTDPGIGSGKSLVVTAGTDISNASAAINTSSLINGQHNLFLRIKNAEGFWSISNVKPLIIGTVLPLSFISFDAINKTDKISLHWKTENEINTFSFSIEKSEDGVHFYSIGNKVALNRPGMHHYQFDDIQPLNGTSYYRLKQIDVDLSISYSDIIPIVRPVADEAFTVSPNPAVGIISVVFTASNRQRNLRLFHSNGSLIKIIPVAAGSSFIQLNVDRFAKGIYLLSLEDEINRTVQKLIKQ